MVFVGLDWAEAHHDVVVMNEAGDVLGELHIDDSLAGVEKIHTVLAPHIARPSDVVIGVETVTNLVVQALISAGYGVYEINPLASSRYRTRHQLSGAKSDRGDAKMLADVVRTDRHNHRPYQGNSEIAESVKVLARAHQSLIHERQIHLNGLRSALRAYYPALLAAFPHLAQGRTRDWADALALIRRAPTPAQGRALSRAQIAAALRQAGRQRGVHERAAEIQTVLRTPQLEALPAVAAAYGAAATASAQIVATMTEQIAVLTQEMAASFEKHPDTEILHSLPGLALVLGARALGEFGDAPNRFANGKARKNYATTSPVTRASGKSRVVAVRCGGNRRLTDTCLSWAFTALNSSPGARRYYDTLRARDKTHGQALRAVANRLVGILHGCLAHRALYDEEIAWPPLAAAASSAA